MPITVEHGGDVAPLAAFAALAAQMAGLKPTGLPEARLSPPGGGGGRGVRSTPIGAPSPVIPRGRPTEEQQMRLQMEYEEKAQRFGLETRLEEKREEGRLEAEKWESQYTAKQRQEIQQHNNAIQAIQQSEDLDTAQQEAMIRKVRMHMAGIQPSQIPSDPDKIQFEPGREPGVLWPGEDGGRYTTIIGSSGAPEAKLLVRPDQTLEYMREKAEFDQQIEKSKQGLADTEARRTSREAIGKMTIDVETKTGTSKRFLNAAERQEQMDFIYGPEDQEENWWDAAEAQGVPITDSDKGLPPDVGFAQAYLRQYPGGYETVPSDKREAWLEAFKIYSNAINALQQGG